ncbi:MAG: hypothetical protein ACTSUE_07835 [Promethearchaeota archaeon]
MTVEGDSLLNSRAFKYMDSSFLPRTWALNWRVLHDFQKHDFPR